MKSLYFSHDANANTDPKILKLLSKYGYEGYGIYWRILEYLYTQDGYLDDYNDVITMLFPNSNNVITMLEYMINLELFHVDKKFRLYSNRLLDTINLQLSKSKKYSEAGKSGMKSRYSKPNNVITTLQQRYNDVITKEKENEIEIKEIKKEIIKEKKQEIITTELQKFIKEKCPNISKIKNQLTAAESERLTNEFTSQEIKEILAAMENYKPLAQKNEYVNLTFRNWIKRRQIK